MGIRASRSPGSWAGRNRRSRANWGATRRATSRTGRRGRRPSRRAVGRRPRKLGAADWERFEERLKAGWSPEQIAGWEQLEGGPGVSATWLYKWLRKDRASGGELYLHLRRQGKRRKAKAAAGEAGAG